MSRQHSARLSAAGCQLRIELYQKDVAVGPRLLLGLPHVTVYWAGMSTGYCYCLRDVLGGHEYGLLLA
jgi:hypothetical protein